MREGKVFVRFGQRPGFRRSVGVIGRRQLDRRVSELDVEVPRVGLAHHLRLERRSDLKRSQSKQVQSQHYLIAVFCITFYDVCAPGLIEIY